MLFDDFIMESNKDRQLPESQLSFWIVVEEKL